MLATGKSNSSTYLTFQHSGHWYLGGWSIAKVSEFKACFPCDRCWHTLCACHLTANLPGSEFPSAKFCDFSLLPNQSWRCGCVLILIPRKKKVHEKNSDYHWTNWVLLFYSSTYHIIVCLVFTNNHHSLPVCWPSRGHHRPAFRNWPIWKQAQVGFLIFRKGICYRPLIMPST